MTGAGSNPAHGWDWKKLAEAGKLACPATGSALHTTGESLLATRDGAHTYQVLPNGVPLLLTDPERIKEYLAASEMPREYHEIARSSERPEAAGAKGLVRKVKAWLHQDYRTDKSLAAAERLFQGLPAGSLCVSVGGGPNRDHPRLVNLNIGPFANVDLVADAHRLPFADGSVDAVYSSAVLEHLYAPTKAAAEMFRILKPGAKVFARTPFLQQYHGYPHHYQNFTLTGHRRLFEDAGFAVDEEGVDVGPTYAFIHITNYYLQEFAPFPLRSRPFRFFWSLFANACLKRMDRKMNLRENAHILASTTFLLGHKP
jgi:hypothetical protein